MRMGRPCASWGRPGRGVELEEGSLAPGAGESLVSFSCRGLHGGEESALLGLTLSWVGVGSQATRYVR